MLLAVFNAADYIIPTDHQILPRKRRVAASNATQKPVFHLFE
jgi:hypothetical protein